MGYLYKIEAVEVKKYSIFISYYIGLYIDLKNKKYFYKQNVV